MRRASAIFLLLAGAGALAGCLGGAEPAELPFTENFTDCDWPTTWDGVKHGECDGGVYRYELSEPGGPYTSWHELAGATDVVEVEVTGDIEQGGRDADADVLAIGCWSEVGGSGYLFMVGGDGTVGVFAEGASGVRLVFETALLSELELPVDLRASCAGGASRTTLAFAVNGFELDVPDQPRPGETFSVVGFAAGTDAAGTTIVFDNFAAHAPS